MQPEEHGLKIEIIEPEHTNMDWIDSPTDIIDGYLAANLLERGSGDGDSGAECKESTKQSPVVCRKEKDYKENKDTLENITREVQGAERCKDNKKISKIPVRQNRVSNKTGNKNMAQLEQVDINTDETEVHVRKDSLKQNEIKETPDQIILSQPQNMPLDYCDIYRDFQTVPVNIKQDTSEEDSLSPRAPLASTECSNECSDEYSEDFVLQVNNFAIDESILEAPEAFRGDGGSDDEVAPMPCASAEEIELSTTRRALVSEPIRVSSHRGYDRVGQTDNEGLCTNQPILGPKISVLKDNGPENKDNRHDDNEASYFAVNMKAIQHSKMTGSKNATNIFTVETKSRMQLVDDNIYTNLQEDGKIEKQVEYGDAVSDTNNSERSTNRDPDKEPTPEAEGRYGRTITNRDECTVGNERETEIRIGAPQSSTARHICMIKKDTATIPGELVGCIDNGETIVARVPTNITTCSGRAKDNDRVVTAAVRYETPRHTLSNGILRARAAVQQLLNDESAVQDLLHNLNEIYATNENYAVDDKNITFNEAVVAELLQNISSTPAHIQDNNDFFVNDSTKTELLRDVGRFMSRKDNKKEMNDETNRKSESRNISANSEVIISQQQKNPTAHHAETKLIQEANASDDNTKKQEDIASLQKVRTTDVTGGYRIGENIVCSRQILHEKEQNMGLCNPITKRELHEHEIKETNITGNNVTHKTDGDIIYNRSMVLSHGNDIIKNTKVVMDETNQNIMRNKGSSDDLTNKDKQGVCEDSRIAGERTLGNSDIIIADGIGQNISSACKSETVGAGEGRVRNDAGVYVRNNGDKINIRDAMNTRGSLEDGSSVVVSHRDGHGQCDGEHEAARPTTRARITLTAAAAAALVQASIARVDARADARAAPASSCSRVSTVKVCATPRHSPSHGQATHTNANNNNDGTTLVRTHQDHVPINNGAADYFHSNTSSSRSIEAAHDNTYTTGASCPNSKSGDNNNSDNCTFNKNVQLVFDSDIDSFTAVSDACYNRTNINEQVKYNNTASVACDRDATAGTTTEGNNLNCGNTNPNNNVYNHCINKTSDADNNQNNLQLVNDHGLSNCNTNSRVTNKSDILKTDKYIDSVVFHSSANTSPVPGPNSATTKSLFSSVNSIVGRLSDETRAAKSVRDSAELNWEFRNGRLVFITSSDRDDGGNETGPDLSAIESERVSANSDRDSRLHNSTDTVDASISAKPDKLKSEPTPSLFQLIEKYSDRIETEISKNSNTLNKEEKGNQQTGQSEFHLTETLDTEPLRSRDINKRISEGGSRLKLLETKLKVAAGLTDKTFASSSRPSFTQTKQSAEINNKQTENTEKFKDFVLDRNYNEFKAIEVESNILEKRRLKGDKSVFHKEKDFQGSDKKITHKIHTNCTVQNEDLSEGNISTDGSGDRECSKNCKHAKKKLPEEGETNEEEDYDEDDFYPQIEITELGSPADLNAFLDTRFGGRCEFDVKRIEAFSGFGDSEFYVVYDELEDTSTEEDDDQTDNEPVKTDTETATMRGDGGTLSGGESGESRTAKRHNPDHENLKSLLKKPGRGRDSGKKNRVSFNENKNEFFDADYIILIREECDYDEDDDDGVCTCNQHEMVRLTCCEPNCNCNYEGGYDGPTPQSPKFAPPLEFVDSVTLSPPEGYKDMDLGEQQLIALQQMARHRQPAVCRECSGVHDSDSNSGSEAEETTQYIEKPQEPASGEEYQQSKTGGTDQQLLDEKEKTDQSQQTTPTTPPADCPPSQSRYIMETITMTTVTERRLVREVDESADTDTTPDAESGSLGPLPPGGSPISGILKGGKLWKQQNSLDIAPPVSNVQNKGSDNTLSVASDSSIVTSDEEGNSINRRSVRFTESDSDKRDSCDGEPDKGNIEELEKKPHDSLQEDDNQNPGETDVCNNSVSPDATEMMLTFKLGSHVLISNNSLRPNSAVRQLFPCSKPLAGKGTEEDGSVHQYLVTAESLRAFEEAKRSKLPQIIQGENDDTIRRTIERNTLRRSLIRYEPRTKKQAPKTDNSLVERIKQLTCDVDEPTPEEEIPPRVSPPGEESAKVTEIVPQLNNRNQDKSFSPSSSSTTSSNSSMSSTYKKITDLFGKREKATSDAQNNAINESNNKQNLLQTAPDLGNGGSEFIEPQHCAVSKMNATSEARKQFLSTLAPLTACVSGNTATDEYQYQYQLANNTGERTSVASSVGTEYSLEDIDEALKNDTDESKKVAPDVLVGTPSASESTDELAMFVQQDASRIERIKKRYQSETTTEEDDEHDDYGFNRRPSVRGIKPRFGSTNEILQQIQSQLQPPATSQTTTQRQATIWPYYSETGLDNPKTRTCTQAFPHQYPYTSEDMKSRTIGHHYRPTSLIEENIYQNCPNQRCSQLHYGPNMNHLHPPVMRIGGGCSDFYQTLPARTRTGRPESPPPMDVSRSFHQTMVLIPYNRIENFQPENVSPSPVYSSPEQCNYARFTKKFQPLSTNKRYPEPLYHGTLPGRITHPTHLEEQYQLKLGQKQMIRVPYSSGQPVQVHLMTSRSESPLPGQFATARATQTPSVNLSTCNYYNPGPPNTRYRPAIGPVTSVPHNGTIWQENPYGSKINRHSFPAGGPRYPLPDNISLADSDSQHSTQLPNGYRQSTIETQFPVSRDTSAPGSPTKSRFTSERGVPEGAASVSPQDSTSVVHSTSTMTSPTSPQNPAQGANGKSLYYAMNV